MIAQILTRFRNMVMAATEPLPRDGAIVETATLNSMTMETETQALVCDLSSSSSLFSHARPFFLLILISVSPQQTRFV